MHPSELPPATLVAVNEMLVGTPLATEDGDLAIVQPPLAALATPEPNTNSASAVTPAIRPPCFMAGVTARPGSSGDPVSRRPETLAGGFDHPGQRRVGVGTKAVDEQLDERFVELGTGGVLELPERLVDRECLAIRPGRRHRRERVTDGADARDKRDVLPGEGMEIPTSVPSLMMMANAGTDEVDVRKVADDHVAERDMLLYNVVLITSQPAGLAKDRIGDADLANVVEQSGDSDRPDSVAVETEQPG